MNKLFTLKALIGFCILSMLIGLPLLSSGQTFPVSINSLGRTATVTSMDVGPTGDIYVTGKIGKHTETTFGPGGCGLNIMYTTFSPGLFKQTIFVAKLKPSGSLDWMVVGISDMMSPDDVSGSDIEVDNLGNAFFTGTMIGNVEFRRIHGGPPASISSCAPLGFNSLRHFVGRIDPNGTPMWVAETEAAVVRTYGEAITLDEANNRLFTGGYADTGFWSETVFFKDEDCTGGCSFNSLPTPSTGKTGFIAEYTMDGVNVRAQKVGEQVMALCMNGDFSEKVWFTGSTEVGGDLDVLLGIAVMPVSLPPCVNFSYTVIPTGGVGGDIGLDIGYIPGSDQVALTGAFTHECIFPSFASLTTIVGNSDIFVATYDHVGGTFTNAKKASDLGGPPLSSIPSSYLQRTACLDTDTDPGSFRMIVGYDMDNVNLATGQIGPSFSYDFFDVIHNVGLIEGPSRAMEVSYGTMGVFGDRYMAGDHYSDLQFGPVACVVPPFPTSYSASLGYVARMSFTHAVYRTGEEENVSSALAHEATPFALYPNPSTGTFTIEWSETLAEAQIEVTDLRGKMIYQEIVQDVQKSNIKLDNISPGLYLVNVRANGQATTQKLVIH